MMRDPDGLPPDHDKFDEETLPETLISEVTAQIWPPLREVRVLDFKDGRSRVDVSHGPDDPSRVWLSIENDSAYVSLSVEEGIARQIWDALGTVLARFREVRSTLRTGKLCP